MYGNPFSKTVILITCKHDLNYSNIILRKFYKCNLVAFSDFYYLCFKLRVMFKSFFQWNADSAGFFASLLCAIHCSAIPILISLGLMSSGSWMHNHLFDWIIIGFGFIMAGYAIVGDYLKKHRKIQPLLFAIAGFAFLIIGMIEHHGWMLIFSVTGGLLVATSHVLNFRYAGACRLKSIVA